MKKTLTSVVASLALASGALPSLAGTSVWNGGTGDWHQGSAWSSGIPGAKDAAKIDGAPGAASRVTVRKHGKASRLLLHARDRLAVLPAGRLSLLAAGGTSRIFGALVIRPDASLFLAPDHVLKGSGTISLTGSGALLQSGTGGFLRMEGPRVTGAGAIEAPGGFVNGGIVSATQAGLALQLTATRSIQSKNGGVLGAEAGGTLVIRSADIANAGLVRASGTGSRVELSDTEIFGGELAAGMGGTIHALPGSALRGVRAVANTPGAVFVGEGALVQGGTFFASAGGRIAFSGGATLDGVHAVASGSAASFELSGVDFQRGSLHAGSEGVLLVESGTVRDTAWSASAGGRVELRNALVVSSTFAPSEGRFEITGTSVLRDGLNRATLAIVPEATATFGGGSHHGTLNQGTIAVGAGGQMILDGGFFNSGKVEVSGTGSSGTLDAGWPGELVGSGTVHMTGSSALLRSLSVNASGHTVVGSGRIEASSASARRNEGLIRADGDGQLLIFDGRAEENDSFKNSGTFAASDGGTLRITSGTPFHFLRFDNSYGTIASGDGSLVELERVVITAGDITGSGTFRVRGDARLNEAYFKSTLENPSGYLGINGIGNYGCITVGDPSGASSAWLALGLGGVGGWGAIKLQGPNAFVIPGTSSKMFVNGGSHTIEGAGTFANAAFGESGFEFVNRGRILANRPDLGPLRIGGANAEGATDDDAEQLRVTNSGVMFAEDGGTLAFDDVHVTNTDGLIRAGNASVVSLHRARIVGGTLENSGTFVSSDSVISSAEIENAEGVFRAEAGAITELDNASVKGGSIVADGTLIANGATLVFSTLTPGAGVVRVHGTSGFEGGTNFSRIEVAPGATARFVSGFDWQGYGRGPINSGTVSVDDNGRLVWDGSAINDGEVSLSGTGAHGGTLDTQSYGFFRGSGTISMGGLSANLLGLDYNEHGHTIRGAGSVRVGEDYYPANHGTIRADLPGQALVLSVPNEALWMQRRLWNSGTLAAADGGRLVITSGNPLHSVLIENDRGLLHAGAGSIIELQGVSIVSGTLAGSGTFLVKDYFSGIGNVHQRGHMEVQSGGLGVSGSVNDGTIAIGTVSGTAPARLGLWSEGISGTGRVLLLGSNSFVGYPSNDPYRNMSNGHGHTIEGAGVIESLPKQNHGTLYNSGWIVGNRPDLGPLRIGGADIFGTPREDLFALKVFNSGTIAARNGATVFFDKVFVLQGATHDIQRRTVVGTGSVIRARDAVFEGGIFTTEGDGKFVFSGSNLVRFSSLGQRVQVEGGSTATLEGRVHLSGTVLVGSPGAPGAVLHLQTDRFLYSVGTEIYIAEGSSLLGSSLFQGTLRLDGTLDPVRLRGGSNPYGLLAVSSTPVIGPSATWKFDLGAVSALGVNCDRFEFAYGYDLGPDFLTLAGTLSVRLTPGFEDVLSGAETFAIMGSGAAIAGQFANVLPGERLTTADGLASFVVNYGPGSRFDPKEVVLSDGLRITSPAPVPEPSGAALVAGGAWLAFASRRRARRGLSPRVSGV